jgi:hypothetical protein
VSDMLRWAAIADDLAFNQLPAARKQAETWRTGLAGLTGLLGAVLIVKGRDTITDLAAGFRYAVVAGLAVGLALLVSATLQALTAASGSPGRDSLLTPEDVRRWTETEVRKSRRALMRARVLTVAGIAVVACAVGVSWLAPAKPADSLVEVETAGTIVCGTIGASGTNTLTVTGDRQVTTMRLSAVTRLEKVPRCG